MNPYRGRRADQGRCREPGRGSDGSGGSSVRLRPMAAGPCLSRKLLDPSPMHPSGPTRNGTADIEAVVFRSATGRAGPAVNHAQPFSALVAGIEPVSLRQPVGSGEAPSRTSANDEITMRAQPFDHRQVAEIAPDAFCRGQVARPNWNGWPMLTGSGGQHQGKERQRRGQESSSVCCRVPKLA